jgi:hypothetical protein
MCLWRNVDHRNSRGGSRAAGRAHGREDEEAAPARPHRADHDGCPGPRRGRRRWHRLRRAEQPPGDAPAHALGTAAQVPGPAHRCPGTVPRRRRHGPDRRRSHQAAGLRPQGLLDPDRPADRGLGGPLRLLRELHQAGRRVRVDAEERLPPRGRHLLDGGPDLLRGGPHPVQRRQRSLGGVLRHRPGHVRGFGGRRLDVAHTCSRHRRR